MYKILEAKVKYDKEHDVKMTTLDIKTLVKEKYLPKEPELPCPECEYYLMEDGSVACKKHGKF